MWVPKKFGSQKKFGQADDVCLVSDDPHRLQCLLQLALEYASEYHVEMVAEKTKLLCFSPRGQDMYFLLLFESHLPNLHVWL